MSLVDIQKLSKRYGHNQDYALQNLTLAVAAGEVYGFLGANGAGKSTTIRLLLNFIQPTSGQATICGLDSVKQSVDAKRHIGYLAGEIALYQKTTGHELLHFLQALQPIKHRPYFDKLIKDFEVEVDKPIAELSKGNRQKIGIVQALMHEPDVLILDEPTSGLDPLMQEVFYSAIAETKKRGAAVFVSSHNLSEVQRLCDRAGIIRAGRLIAEKDVADLRQNVGRIFNITFDKAIKPALLKQIPHVQLIQSADTSVVLRVATDINPLLAFLAKHTIISLSTVQDDLEEEFLHLYEGEA
jgi:ABC-2 type transport system ATP-binding protein